MGLFDLFKRQRQPEEAEEIPAQTPDTGKAALALPAGLVVSTQQDTDVIELPATVDMATVEALLACLRKSRIDFSLYDPFYPSPSDPGAYISYSQEKNDVANAWSMTLSNHGWSGGIYTIAEENIVLQIMHLVKNKKLQDIKISGVSFFSHYKTKEDDVNAEKNALLYKLHHTG